MILTALLALGSAAADREPGPRHASAPGAFLAPAGGTMRRPAISPSDPDVVVLGGEMTGSRITRDGGLSWRLFHLGRVVSGFAFDPGDANVIYAGNAARWRSEDGGRRWALVFPDPARHTVRHGWGHHGDTSFTTEDPRTRAGWTWTSKRWRWVPWIRGVSRSRSAPHRPGPGQPPVVRDPPARLRRPRPHLDRAGDPRAPERAFAIAFERAGAPRAVAEGGVYVVDQASRREAGRPATASSRRAWHSGRLHQGPRYGMRALPGHRGGPVGISQSSG